MLEAFLVWGMLMLAVVLVDAVAGTVLVETVLVLRSRGDLGLGKAEPGAMVSDFTCVLGSILSRHAVNELSGLYGIFVEQRFIWNFSWNEAFSQRHITDRNLLPASVHRFMIP